VTAATVVRKIAAVRIIIIIVMAGDAFGLGISEDLAKVAGLTFDVAVFAEQWKSSQVVREIRRFLPTRVIVTVLTLFFLITFMHVIVEMT
jgi:hypothetical protein